MATPTLKGTTEPLLQSWELNFSPTQGATSERLFRGTSITKMQALANFYGQNRWTCKLRQEFGIATLTVSAPNSSGGGSSTTPPVSDITDKWEMVVEQERPDLCENPNFQTIFSTANASAAAITGVTDTVSAQFFSVLRGVAASASPTLKQLKESMDNYVMKMPNGDDFADGNTLADYDSVFDFLTAGDKFISDYFRGANTFTRSKYTLRHTTNAPDTFGPNVADFGVGKIYTIAQLLSETENPDLWIFPLPGYLAYKILSLPAPSAAPANYQWGALKTGSNAVTATNNRVEITTEYIIDSWPIHTYGLY